MNRPHHPTSPTGVECIHRHVHLPHGDRRQLIRLILTTWTGRGALIADLDDDPLTETAAAEAGRLYYPPTSDDLHQTPPSYGWADLVMLTWPRAEHPHRLLKSCRRILQPAGRIVIRIISPPPQRNGHLCALAGAAGRTRLRLDQHLACTDQLAAGRSRLVHTDLLALVHRDGGEPR